ncbi:MAG TPA: leucine--tRNA ligase [Patescibacteria group bacterium]|nr:leucine--tRNA ligase [Patescibacteria group bacterium]
MKKYNHKQIEKKWQTYWLKFKTFAAKDGGRQKKKYVLDMFPYPSGAGLHVGHPEGYTATDILSRYYRMKGFNVLHPMGWDAFGLPAENYAIKEGIHPQKTTQKNIKRFRQQIQSLGLSYDWSRELNTSDPAYYKWTQWLFLQLFRRGLAYKKEAYVNWCPKDNTVLANEQVINGACERCGTEVVQKNLSQWFFKITDYAEELLADLDQLDWPEPIKLMQRNWIGKSAGAEIDFEISGQKNSHIKVFTTRPDTIFGATYLVLAPEHPAISNLKYQISNWEEVQNYIEAAKKKSELQRTQLEKEKTGVELKGIKAINPASKEEIPVWIADYVITGYGTGAIMAVPAHDERDWAFAKKFDLPIRQAVEAKPLPNEGKAGESLQAAVTDYGMLVNSGEFNGLASKDAILKIANKYGKLTTKYKLRDWLVSRQRYWGAPIPIIYCEKCGMQPVPEKDLPVKLPADVDFRPTGESPLKRSKSFKKVVCPKCKGKAERDYDTMDTFVDSSWYFLRYADPKNKSKFAAAKKMEKWVPVDFYVGGAEHAVLHLLYARFFTKALRDFGYLKFNEPFLELRNQGLILGPDGEKMSKSRGNVINPDDVVRDYGADSLRMYEMFMGPLEDAKPWQTNGIVGIRRFLDRVWQWAQNSSRFQVSGSKARAALGSDKVQRALHKLIKKITEDIEGFRFNTAISAFMEFHNEVKDEAISPAALRTFLILLYPFAPHLAEELHWSLGGKKSLQLEKWPAFDAAKIAESTAEIVVQVNGKVRGKIKVAHGASQAAAVAEAEKLAPVKQALAGQAAKRIIYVSNRLLNLVI